MPAIQYWARSAPEICAFLEKTTPYGKIVKTSESFHRLADRRVVFKFREIWPMGNR